MDISKESLEVVVIGLIILIVILLIILIICCFKYRKRNSKQPPTREVRFINGTTNNSNNMVSPYMKSFELDDNNMGNSNGFKSFYSHGSEKPMLDSSTINSFSMRHPNNSNDFVDMPPASINNSTMNRSMMENIDHGSLNRGYLSPTININNANYTTYDLGNPSIHRLSYSSTNVTNDSQYIPSHKNIMNYSFTEINDIRRNRGQNTIEYDQSKLSPNYTSCGRVATPSPSMISSKMSSPVIAASIPGNLGRNNLKTIPMISDNSSPMNLHESSFQSNRSHISYTNSPKERVYLNSNMYKRTSMTKNYSMDNVLGNSHLSPNQLSNEISIGNLRIGPTINIENMDHCDVDDIDAIVDDAENILESLSHHSYSSCNNQNVSMLGAAASSRQQMNGNISNIAIRARNSFDQQDLSFSSQNPIDAIVGGMNTGIIQRGRSNSQNNSFQKTIPLQVQPSMDTFLRQIPEGEIVKNSKGNESVIDQSGYNTSFTGRANRSSKNYESEGYTNINIIPAELKNNSKNSFYVDEEEITSSNNLKYAYSKNQMGIDKDTDIDDLSKIRIQKLYETNDSDNNMNSFIGLGSPTSPISPIPYCNPKSLSMNVNIGGGGGFLNYKKEQIKGNMNGEGQNQIKSFNIANAEPSLSIKVNDHSSLMQDSILKSPSNFYIKSPLSPTNSNDTLVNLNKMEKANLSCSNIPMERHHITAVRGSSFDDYTNNMANYSTTSIDRMANNNLIRNNNNNNNMNNSFYLLRSQNQSQASLSTINSTMSRNAHYSSFSKNQFSTLKNCDDATNNSIISESTISVKNINAPSVKHSHKYNNNNNQMPMVHKVEINNSIEDIPKNVDINDEVEEDVFMRPSMVRYVEIEPGPVLQQEAETTRISFISTNSSDQDSLNQNILKALEDDSDEEEEVHVIEEDEYEQEAEEAEVEVEVEEEEEEEEEEVHVIEDEEENTAKNYRLESPMTITSLASPTACNHEIIIGNDDLLKKAKKRGSTSSCLELLKNNGGTIEDEDLSSPTLHENSVVDEKTENNKEIKT